MYKSTKISWMKPAVSYSSMLYHQYSHFCCCWSSVAEAPPTGQEGHSISDEPTLQGTSAPPQMSTLSSSLPTASPKLPASTAEARTEGCSHVEVSNNTEGIQKHLRVELPHFLEDLLYFTICNFAWVDFITVFSECFGASLDHFSDGFFACTSHSICWHSSPLVESVLLECWLQTYRFHPFCLSVLCFSKELQSWFNLVNIQLHGIVSVFPLDV